MGTLLIIFSMIFVFGPIAKAFADRINRGVPVVDPAATGEIARLRGTASGRGVFLDRMHHRLVEPCLFVAVALHEHLRTGSLLPLAAGFATVVLANAIEENQHLAAYIGA